MNEGYNGNWPNKVTWLVFTWLTDKGGQTEQWARDIARNSGSALRLYVEELVGYDDLEMYTEQLAVDFITAALDTVDWEYLAKALREE